MTTATSKKMQIQAAKAIVDGSLQGSEAVHPAEPAADESAENREPNVVTNVLKLDDLTESQQIKMQNENKHLQTRRSAYRKNNALSRMTAFGLRGQASHGAVGLKDIGGIDNSNFIAPLDLLGANRTA